MTNPSWHHLSTARKYAVARSSPYHHPPSIPVSISRLMYTQTTRACNFRDAAQTSSGDGRISQQSVGNGDSLWGVGMKGVLGLPVKSFMMMIPRVATLCGKQRSRS